MAHPPHFANAGVLYLDPATIDPDLQGRIGLFFPAKAEAYAALIKANGQNDPIKVRKAGPRAKFEWKLVAGLHRLEACKIAGELVTAIEVLGSADDALLIQASENIDRRELAPIERAMFVAAVAEAAQRRLEQRLDGKTQQAIAAEIGQSQRRSNLDQRSNRVQFTDVEKADEAALAARSNLSRAYGWRDETAEACGLSLSDLKRSLRIYRCIVEPNRDLMDAFKDHPVAQKSTDLLTICALNDSAVRRKVIETLNAGPADLGYALLVHGIKTEAAKPDAYSKFTSQIAGGVDRLGTADWKRFCPTFAMQLTPAKRIALREALNEAIGDAA